MLIANPDDEADRLYLESLGRNQRLGVRGPVMPRGGGEAYGNPMTPGALGRDVMSGVTALAEGFSQDALMRGMIGTQAGIHIPPGARIIFDDAGRPYFMLPDEAPRPITDADRRHGGLLDLMDAFPMAGVQGGGAGTLGAGARRGGPRRPRARGADDAVPPAAAPETPPAAPAAPPVSPPTGEIVAGSHGTLGQGQRGMAAVPNLRAMTPEEAIEVARREPHLIQGPDGQFVGAPRGVTTREQIEALRRDLDAAVDAGASGGDWYERARGFAREWGGGSVRRERDIAAGNALLSPQATPDTNLGFYLTARNHYEAGVPVSIARTGAQASSYNAARRAGDEARDIVPGLGRRARDPVIGEPGHDPSKPANARPGHNSNFPIDDDGVNPGELPRLGRKTGIYGQHIDPTLPPATTGTNDTWHARALGYRDADGTPWSGSISGNQMHTWMDYETMLAADRANARNAGGRSNWTGAEIQAAPWVALKGRSLSEGAARNAPISVEEGIRRASETYPEAAPRHTFSATHEQIPGRSTGILPGILDAPLAERQAFSDAANWRNAAGNDALYHEMGLLTGRDRQGIGAYTNSQGVVEQNPVTVSRALVASRPLPNGQRGTAAVDLAAMDAGEATRALIDAQEAGAANRVITQPYPGDPARSTGAGSTALVVQGPNNAMPNAAQMRELNATVERWNADPRLQAGNPNPDNPRFIVLANNENGVSIFVQGGDTPISPGAFSALVRGGRGREGMAAELQRAVPGSRVARGSAESVYVPLDWSQPGSGNATREWMQRMERLRATAPRYYENLLDAEVPSRKAAANLRRLYEAGGGSQRADYQRLLELVQEGRLRGLTDRIRRLGYEGLPAAAGAVGLGAAHGSLLGDE